MTKMKPLSKRDPFLIYTIGVCVGVFAMAVSAIVPSFGWGLVAGIIVLTAGRLGVQAALAAEEERP